MVMPSLVLNLTVHTTDGAATAHQYDWPRDSTSQVELRRELTRRVQAGLLDQTIGAFSFERPSVLYNPSQMVRTAMEIPGPEEERVEIEAVNKQLGFLQSEPGRGRTQ